MFYGVINAPLYDFNYEANGFYDNLAFDYNKKTVRAIWYESLYDAAEDALGDFDISVERKKILADDDLIKVWVG